MCTVSWLADVDSYHLFFNRDESRTRDEAHSPRSFRTDGVEVLMPVDPSSEGSWIATNEFGFSLALLNFYQGQTPAGELVSRGQIIRQLGHLSSDKEVYTRLKQWPLSRSAPFSLLVFSPDSDLKAIPLFQWDGHTLLKKTQLSPLISSAFDFDSVVGGRVKQFEDALAEVGCSSDRVTALKQLHQSHKPDRSAYSICMHRSDAHTVSGTQVSVNLRRVQMAYHAGSPCKGMQPVVSTTRRRFV